MTITGPLSQRPRQPALLMRITDASGENPHGQISRAENHWAVAAMGSPS